MIMASAYGACPIKHRHRRSKGEIEQIKTVILTALDDDHPMTVRQVFYRLVSDAASDPIRPDVGVPTDA